MRRDWVGMLRRGIKKPPGVVIQRIWQEAQGEIERFVSPFRVRKISGAYLANQFDVADVNALWRLLSGRPFPMVTGPVNPAVYETTCPSDKQRILSLAEKALARKVDLLGSGPVPLGDDIDWNKDYKTGFMWPNTYYRSIDYNNPDRPSDVKFPWELSRMQWMIPLGQAYLLTGDEHYALSVKENLCDWIGKNPYAASVNWACTMEVALRIIVWTWFFHVFKNSPGWQDHKFQASFLKTLFLHGDFTLRHLERSDINGNHFTANAAGLVFAGLFFKGCKDAHRWIKTGWDILLEELPRQVSSDGVDFEGSTSYHRLVTELFFLPAVYREVHGLDTPGFYQERVRAMAQFTKAYTQPDGNAPFWGDADDARTLPFGGQNMNDHRYLLGIIGLQWQDSDLQSAFSGSKSEVFWLLGGLAASSLPDKDFPAISVSESFPDGGYYVLCDDENHVFIDCAPIGLSGRGGHGHNDCLSFELVLAKEKLITDCGTYLYTASYEERNNFRSTAYHNTPIIDSKEINRFIRKDYLWNMHDDAYPEVTEFKTSTGKSTVKAGHSGYKRLPGFVSQSRKFDLYHIKKRLCIEDTFRGKGRHEIRIPFHFAIGVSVKKERGACLCLISKSGKIFYLEWEPGKLEYNTEIARVSERYGITSEISRFQLMYTGHLPVTFRYRFQAK